jgi:hypothetical protein
LAAAAPLRPEATRLEGEGAGAGLVEALAWLLAVPVPVVELGSLADWVAQPPMTSAAASAVKICVRFMMYLPYWKG